MKKEEVLEKSRIENKKRDVYEIEVDNKAGRIASIATILLAFTYFTYEVFTGKGANYALYSILTIYNAVLYGYKSVKIEKCRVLNIISAAIWGLLTVLLILDYFNII